MAPSPRRLRHYRTLMRIHIHEIRLVHINLSNHNNRRPPETYGVR